jgi:hypothetical protein
VTPLYVQDVKNCELLSSVHNDVQAPTFFMGAQGARDSLPLLSSAPQAREVLSLGPSGSRSAPTKMPSPVKMLPKKQDSRRECEASSACV